MTLQIRSLLKRLQRLERRQQRVQTTNVIGRGESWGRLCSNLLALPSLRGFWPMSSVSNSAFPRDISTQDRTMGNINVSIFGQDGLIPYVEFNGATQYLARATEAGLDITGTETYVLAAQRGLTIGGWFYVSSFDAAVTPYFGKWQAVNQFSYLIACVGAGSYGFRITTDGTTQVAVTSTVTRATGQWIFLVGRFDPSTELAIYVDGVKTPNVAGIPASIFNSTSDLAIGFEGADTVYLDGRASACFLCAQMLTDDSILALYRNTKRAFGV